MVGGANTVSGAAIPHLVLSTDRHTARLPELELGIADTSIAIVPLLVLSADMQTRHLHPLVIGGAITTSSILIPNLICTAHGYTGALPEFISGNAYAGTVIVPILVSAAFRHTCIVDQLVVRCALTDACILISNLIGAASSNTRATNQIEPNIAYTVAIAITVLVNRT